MHPPKSEETDIFKILHHQIFYIGYIWNSQQVILGEYYRSKLTEDGLCWTFNTINDDLIYRKDVVDPKFLTNSSDYTAPKLWSMEMGYSPGRVKHFPFRSYGNTKTNGLQILLELVKNAPTENIDELCRKNPYNYKISLHHPTEIFTSNHFKIPTNKSAIILIKPKITRTADSLLSYDPQIRKCFFTGERQLKFFQIYTKLNCEFECLTNLTLRYCNCSTFFMPSKLVISILFRLSKFPNFQEPKRHRFASTIDTGNV